MIIYIPYTYLIGWSEHNIWYYGVRYAKGCQPSDLWTFYFTSSKLVKSARETYGEPDVVQIRRTFLTEDAARNWETKVLRRIKVVVREDFLNQTDNIAISIETASVAKPGTAKAMVGNNNASGNKGKPKSLAHRLAIGAALKDKPKSEDQKQKQSAAMTGRKQSAESNEKRSRTLTGRKRGPYKKKSGSP